MAASIILSDSRCGSRWRHQRRHGLRCDGRLRLARRAEQVHVHDLHATILHLMGIDHERLTYRYSGRDFRLNRCCTGKIVRDILA